MSDLNAGETPHCLEVGNRGHREIRKFIGGRLHYQQWWVSKGTKHMIVYMQDEYPYYCAYVLRHGSMVCIKLGYYAECLQAIAKIPRYSFR